MIAAPSLFLAVARADGAELTWLEGWLVLACLCAASLCAVLWACWRRACWMAADEDRAVRQNFGTCEDLER